MARTKDYSHFCPVARSLEVIGEKWSLLVVRDLLRGPQRFTDLHRYLGSITPKWLTARLRELEAVGIVERDQQPGRRDVWYRLTDKGRELAPVVSALAVWGMDNAMRAPLAGEAVYPEQMMMAFVNYLIRKRIRLSQPVTWQLRFDDHRSWVVTFDGARWAHHAGDAEADIEIAATIDAWTDLLTHPRDKRDEILDRMRITGAKKGIAEFRDIMTTKQGAYVRPRRVPAAQ